MITFSVFPLPLLKLNEGSLQCFKKTALTNPAGAIHSSKMYERLRLMRFPLQVC